MAKSAPGLITASTVMVTTAMSSSIVCPPRMRLGSTAISPGEAFYSHSSAQLPTAILYQANGANPYWPTTATNARRTARATTKANSDVAEVAGFEKVTALVEIVGGRRDHRRHREKEAELGGGTLLNADEASAKDRCPGAADAWNHREALYYAHAGG